MEFKEWWEEWGREDPGIREKVSRGWAEFIWDASRANIVESEPEEPTPTEMVRMLLEKGWILCRFGDERRNEGLCLMESTDHENYYWFNEDGIALAYRKAFPPKKRVEVEMWICSFCERTGRTQDDFGCHHRDPKVKGTAVFWVEESR